MNSEEYIKQCATRNIAKFNNNAPTQYEDANTQYMADRNRAFVANRAYIAADFITAEVQGLTDNFYEYTTTDIRLSDVTTNNVTAFDSKKTDDFKEVLLAYYEYIPIGAKIKALGSTWIVQNPANLSSPNATAIVARCNAVFNQYDYYGNIISEPVIVQKTQMLDSSPIDPLNLVLMDGYFNIICQNNENTANLNESRRLVFGKKVYEIAGYSDFIQEFTDDFDSAKLATFRAQVKEPTIYDDMEKRIADGKSFKFDMQITNIEPLVVGQTETLNADFLKNDEIILPTAENPLTWQWEIEDSNIATIDENGNVTGVAEGSTVVKVTLKENPNITANVGIAVLSAVAPYIKISNENITTITQFNTVTYTARYYVNNEPTTAIVDWTVSGANKKSYNATISGNDITIQCVSPAEKALVIQAEHNGVIATRKIKLEGY